MMVSDLDLLRSARLVLDQYGEDALIHAAERAEELLERGDVEGCEVWCKIGGILQAARLAQSFKDE